MKTFCRIPDPSADLSLLGDGAKGDGAKGDGVREMGLYRFTTSLPYLLNRAGVRMGELFSRELAPYDVTLPMYRVLASLAEQGDQRLSDLSRMTVVEISTLSRLIATLQRRGLVIRERLDSNLREVQIRLTPAGRDLAAELMPKAAHYEAVAIQDFGDAETAILKRGLSAINDRLTLLEREGTDRPCRNTSAFGSPACAPRHRNPRRFPDDGALMTVP